MAAPIQMPKLGLTMQEGTITEWLVAAGDRARPGEVLLRIETDKVEADVPAEAEGVVHPLGALGQTFPCGAVIGWLLGDGEAAPEGDVPAAGSAAVEAGTTADVPAASEPPTLADPDAPVPGAGAPRLLASPNARRVAAERGIDLRHVVGTGPGGRIVSEDLDRATAPPTPPVPGSRAAGGPSGRFVPFAAAKAAERLGIDLSAVAGSGPGGRVTRADVYAHARSTPGWSGPGRTSAGGVTPPSPGPASPTGDRQPLTTMRRVIAERMHASIQQTAQLTLSMEVDMGRCVELRDQFRALSPDEVGVVPGFTDFVIAAVARALVEHPRLNSRLDGDAIVVEPGVHVGMAVAIDDGLVVPVVRDADRLPLPDLAVETARLAEAARTRALGMADLEGATFCVTALGSYGVDMFTPILQPPNAGILGVGRLRDGVAWEGAHPVKRRVLTLSLTWDHRILDGAPAAEFTRAVVHHLEQPLGLLA